MLFWIFCILLAGGIIWSCFVDDYDDTYIPSRCLAAGGATAVVVSLVIIACTHIGVDGYVAKMHARHEVLTYQLENDIYDNDNDIGKRELMEEIQYWNEDLASLRENQDDFWIGIYVPNVHDQFEPIKLERGTEQ